LQGSTKCAFIGSDGGKIGACSLSHFYKLIFKMPHANCTAVQLGLCRLSEGWSDSYVFDFLIFLNISAWNILVRV
jgi:hypothetical protein